MLYLDFELYNSKYIPIELEFISTVILVNITLDQRFSNCAPRSPRALRE
jgi:hypothetical protein